jgi:hypothetical protein
MRENQLPVSATSGLYCKPNMIINNDSRVINKLETSRTDDARVVIYDNHMFIVQATGGSIVTRYVLQLSFTEKSQNC